MILITDFISPAAETATRIDVLFLEFGKELFEHAFALETWGWVAVVKASVVGAYDFVGWLEHFGVDEAGDAVSEHVFLIDRFHGGFGDFEHDGPVGSFLGGGGFGGIA